MRSKKILAAVLTASASVVGLTWSANKLIFHLSTMKKLLSNEHSGLYHWHFGDIYYIKCGQGSPILLVHDLNSTSSSYEWKVMINRLAKKHTVYAIDLLGCGHSSKPKMTYTNYLYVQLLNDFVKDVIKGKTDIVATASSSPLAIMACHMDASLYRKIVMINPQMPEVYRQTPTLGRKVLKYVIEFPVFGTLIYNIRNAFFSIKKTFADKYFSTDDHIEKMDIYAYYEAAHIGGSASRFLYASIRSNYTNLPVDKAIQDENHSILIIGGSEVPGINQIIETYQTMNPAIEAEIIEGAKYLPQMEKPEALENIIDIYQA